MKTFNVMCYMGMQYSVVPILAKTKQEAISKAMSIAGVVSATIH